jgi:hypothetical protein
MPLTIQAYCENNNITLITDHTTLACNIISSYNTLNVNIKLQCGHEKTIKISSLASKKYTIKCLICKNMSKYNYNYLTKERLCTTCNTKHKNIQPTNLKNFKCCICVSKISNKIKHEIELYKFLIQNYDVSKNYKFPNSKTCDMYLNYKDNLILIEVDDSSHYSDIAKLSHFEKDQLVLDLKLILIRVYSKSVDSFIDNLENVLNYAILNNTKITIFKDNNNDDKFFHKIYKNQESMIENLQYFDKREKNVYIPDDLSTILELSENEE